MNDNIFDNIHYSNRGVMGRLEPPPPLAPRK